MVDAESGHIEKFGFYTTRWVNAGSSEEAEIKALALLRSEKTFAPPRGHAPSKDAKVYFEKIVEVDGPHAQGGGATWFPMDESRDA